MKKEYEDLVGRYEEYYTRKGIIIGVVCSHLFWVLAYLIYVTR